MKSRPGSGTSPRPSERLAAVLEELRFGQRFLESMAAERAEGEPSEEEARLAGELLSWADRLRDLAGEVERGLEAAADEAPGEDGAGS